MNEARNVGARFDMQGGACGEFTGADLLAHSLDSSPDYALIVDQGGRIHWANRAAREILRSSTPRCPVTENWLDLWHNDHAEEAKASLASAAHRSGRFTGRLGFAGDEQWWETVLSPIPSSNNSRVCILCVARDITGRHTLARASQEAEARYHALFDNAVDGIFHADAAGVAVSVNPALAALIGMASPDQVLADWPRFHGESFADPSRRVDFFTTLEADGVVRGLDYALRRYDGTEVWVSISARLISNDAGLPIGYEGSLKDITSRRAAEKLIREQADFLNRANEAILVTNLDDRVSFWNRGAERMLGWSAAEVLGRDPAEFIGSNVGRISEIRKQVLQTGEWHGEIAVADKHGRPIVLDARFSLIRNESGQPVARLCIASDITERSAWRKTFSTPSASMASACLPPASRTT